MESNSSLAKDNLFVIDDDIWEELIQLTNGAAALCYQCGVCTAACPWGLVKQEPLTVRTFIRQAQIGFGNGAKNLWLCTTCGQCEAYCPRGVDISDVFRGLRTIAWERRKSMEGLSSMLWSIFWNNNPWTQPPSQRTRWAANLDIPIFDPAQHEILLYIGCTSSYDSRAQCIAQSLVQVLKAAQVKFGYLGEEEPCCGEAVLSVGHKPYFKEIANEVNRFMKDKGVVELVTISPHCYDVFKNHYPRGDGEEVFTPYHYTQYCAKLMELGKLRFESNLEKKVTFQDPCYLGRHNNEYTAPRQIIQAIEGVEFVEMSNSGIDGLCCGGGGGRMWLETEPGERFADYRIGEAAKSGAEILVTACPFCVVCLEDSAKSNLTIDMRVMDVAEIAALALN
jgi:Fe-S oxidoreductase